MSIRACTPLKCLSLSLALGSGFLVGACQPEAPEAPPEPSGPAITLEWTDLLPEEDLRALENRPEYLDDIEDGSAEDSIANTLNNVAGQTRDDPYHQALVSTKVRSEYHQRKIRLPGFIVPLDFDDQNVVTTFFLVPFFGACIHQPPPPPNQIIFAEYEPGKKIEVLYDAFWVEGTLHTTLVENDMAKAAYSMSVDSITPYY